MMSTYFLCRAALSLALVAALTSCGGTPEVVPAPSFALTVRTVESATAPGVLLESVGQLEIKITPRLPAVFAQLAGRDAVPHTADDGAPPNCSFDDCGGSPCCKYEGGEVTTFVSAAGEYVIRYDGSWVRAHAQITPTGFSVVTPIYATSEMDSPGGLDPSAAGTILRGADRIAAGGITLPWPLPAGGMQGLPILCVAGFESECMNVDPSIPLDGGP